MVPRECIMNTDLSQYVGKVLNGCSVSVVGYHHAPHLCKIKDIIAKKKEFHLIVKDENFTHILTIPRKKSKCKVRNQFDHMLIIKMKERTISINLETIQIAFAA